MKENERIRNNIVFLVKYLSVEYISDEEYRELVNLDPENETDLLIIIEKQVLPSFVSEPKAQKSEILSDFKKALETNQIDFKSIHPHIKFPFLINNYSDFYKLFYNQLLIATNG